MSAIKKEKEGRNMNEDKEFLGKEPIGKLLLRLALPTVAAQLINMLYNIVDRIYIGHIPEIGAKALTGVGVCMPLILIVSAFAALVGYGGAPRASIAMGRKDNEAAEKILGNCFTVQILISVILTVVLLIWNRDFLMAFGASENTIEYGVRYMSIYALGTLFVEVTLGMNSFITAQGFAKTGMLSVLIGAVANIILDPIFIFGFDMDVQGAALATILSQAMSCIWVVWFLCGKKTTLKIRRKNIGITPKVVLPCLALGVSVFVMQASESVISVCFNSSLQKYGGDIAVGAMTILTSVMQFAMLPLQGLGQGAQPIISYNYGAGNMKRVRRTFRLLLQSSLAYSTILWLLILLFPQGFAAMFTSDPELMIFTRTALRIYMAACVIFGIQIACQMTFNALGNAVESITVAVVRKFVLLIPLIYLMPMLLKGDQAKAVYMAEPIADVIAVMFTACLFFFRFKKTLEKENAESGGKGN
jgi:putative MATE family efflux protein